MSTKTEAMKLRYPVRSPIRSAISGVHERRHGSRTLAQIIQALTGPAYYDASVIGSLWKDVAGTDPVTTTGDLVARMDDLSGVAHVLQATEALRPSYDSTLGGRLVFSGAQCLSSAVNFDPAGSTTINLIAAARKLSDAAAGYVLALMTTSSLSQDGTAQLAAPPTAALGQIRFIARGTAAVTRSATVAAPVSSVVAGFADIAAPVTRIRMNGAPAQIDIATSLGTGTFMPHLIHIGGRTSTTDLFNGHFHAGIVVPTITDADRNAIEAILMARIGV